MGLKDEIPAAPLGGVEVHPERLRIVSEGRTVSDRLWNEDLAPARERRWNVRSLFALWMCDVHSIAGYTFAAGLFITGLVGWQVFLALVVGITAVYFLMNFAGTAGQKTGVPYPVLARMSFGLFGANLAALIRAVIAIAWYGIQTWLASEAVLVLLFSIWPSLAELDDPAKNPEFLGLTPIGWAAFLVLWAVQLLVIRRGMETVRRFQDWAGPAIWVAMFALAIYIVVQAGDRFSLSIPGVAPLEGPAAVSQFFSAIALTITYFAALLLNFCDFSRFAPDRKTILRGNFWGLPVNFIAFALVTVVVTAGAASYFTEREYRGQEMFQVITDPVNIVRAINDPWITGIAAVTFVVATIGINVVANFVSASYDLANVAPHRINFRRGGLISAILAIVILPWNLFNSPVVITYFLGGLGALLGPLFGVIFTDFFRLRRQRFKISDLYHEDEQGHYYYRHGWNPKALAALIPAAVVAGMIALIPGLQTILPGGAGLGPYSWFVGAILSATIYFFLTRNDPGIQRAVAEADA
ncbi:NCS1 family nucleobase:cation symporter-1 [Arthrobacter sp. M4]|uniref:NCS1 family nucleobase:cation symporter-1 n=1 Tax=Arthrobacter sp. M4 TaxID=218160 RepID=UPI001CDB7EAA|nr:NCS1 family nucleobase:cation symporter-1 [Arthrobacter sp. M4]MCA4135419.1 NCS1 family nucleobase:cation symporter-1 [Arthrobacter sp. M4]